MGFGDDGPIACALVLCQHIGSESIPLFLGQPTLLNPGEDRHP